MTHNVVWKYTLNGTDNPITLPEGAELLTVGGQDNNICLWVRVDPAAPRVPRMFFVVGTGFPIPDDADKYIGSAMIRNGMYVFHVFEAKR
jgi:hypothetical protein